MISQTVLDIIEKISNEHCHKVFGYLDKEDLKNEIWVICLEKIKDYDERRGPLEHFLRVSVKTRLINRFKDITKSVRSPCSRCPFFDPGNLKNSECTKYRSDKYLCAKWKNYRLSVESRNSLLNAAEDQHERLTTIDMNDLSSGTELIEIVRKNIGVDYKKDFEDFLSGSRLSKQKTKRLQREIIRIVRQRDCAISLCLDEMHPRKRRRKKRVKNGKKAT